MSEKIKLDDKVAELFSFVKKKALYCFWSKTKGEIGINNIL